MLLDFELFIDDADDYYFHHATQVTDTCFETGDHTRDYHARDAWTRDDRTKDDREMIRRDYHNS